MKVKGDKRWSVLQRLLFVVRNLKSLVASGFLSRKYPSRTALPNSSPCNSDIHTDFHDTKNNDYLFDLFSPLKSNSTPVAQSPNKKRQKIGDISRIASRYSMLFSAIVNLSILHLIRKCNLIRIKLIFPFRTEAQNVQLRIEEKIGSPLRFTLHPGDSVFQTFDEVQKGKDIRPSGKMNCKRVQDDQWLTVTSKHRGLKKPSSYRALEMIADYLKTDNRIEYFESGTTNKKKKKLQRCNSECLIPFYSQQPAAVSVLSEYKEYLRHLAKNMTTPKMSKIFPSPWRRAKEANPIVVVTKHN